MKREEVILQGGGEHARVVLDSLLSAGRNVVAIFDPKYEGVLFGVPQRGVYDPDMVPEAVAVIAIGNNKIRKEVESRTRHRFTRVIDTTAVVSPRSSVGEGTMILHGAVIQAQSAVGRHVIINTGARIDHDCRVGDYSHLAPGAILCGTVEIGEGAFVGAGAVVLPGIKVGAWATVGAGSIVTRDIPEGATAFGNPARVVKMANR